MKLLCSLLIGAAIVRHIQYEAGPLPGWAALMTWALMAALAYLFLSQDRINEYFTK